MLRAKIDLRQPSFLLRPRTVTATVSSQGLKNTQFPRFGAEIILHIIGMRTSLLCTGAPTSLPRELGFESGRLRPPHPPGLLRWCMALVQAQDADGHRGRLCEERAGTCDVA
jgi:hypothetical protein